MSGTLKLFGSTKNSWRKQKMEKPFQVLKLVEVLLVQCSSVHNQYQ